MTRESLSQLVDVVLDGGHVQVLTLEVLLIYADVLHALVDGLPGHSENYMPSTY